MPLMDFDSGLSTKNVSSYCTHRWHVGHAKSFYRVHHPELKASPKPSPKRGYVLKRRLDSDTRKVTLVADDLNAVPSVSVPPKPTGEQSQLQEPVPPVLPTTNGEPSTLATSSLISTEVSFPSTLVEDVSSDAATDIDKLLDTAPLLSLTKFGSHSLMLRLFLTVAVDDFGPLLFRA